MKRAGAFGPRTLATERVTRPVQHAERERPRKADGDRSAAVNKEQWLRSVEMKLNTDEERAFLRGAVANMTPEHLARVTRLSVDDAVFHLRCEMGTGPSFGTLTTRKAP